MNSIEDNLYTVRAAACCDRYKTRYDRGMKRTMERAPMRSVMSLTHYRGHHEKPEYTPAFSMSKNGTYASYVTVRDVEKKQWHVYLCEREDCAHAHVHLCTLPLEVPGKRRPPCARCNATQYLSWHHIYPQRFFKRNVRLMQYKISLCRDCHNDIEKHIPERRPLSPHQYVHIAHTFLKA
jgi:hypothetical protein